MHLEDWEKIYNQLPLKIIITILKTFQSRTTILKLASIPLK